VCVKIKCVITFNIGVVYNCVGGNGYWWKRERSAFGGNRYRPV